MERCPIYDGCFFGDGEDQPTNWKLGRKVARGVNTQVSHVIDVNKLHRGKCVVKQAFMSDDTDVTCLTAIESEITALRNVKHRRILEYIGFSRSDKVFSLFLPYMEKGSLATYIKSHNDGHLTEEKTALFTSQILEGLDYLHKHNIIHRDIKGSNVLMKNDIEVKISDFGTAKILNTLSKAHTLGTGTRNWMAPEIILELPYDSKVDIWSLGCTVYQMVTGIQPFNDLSETQIIARGLKNQLQLSSPDHLSPNLKDILHLMFIKQPAERPNAAELMKHKFITGTEKYFPLSGAVKYRKEECSKDSCTQSGNHLDILEDYNSMVSEEDLSKYFRGTHEVQECLKDENESDLYIYKAKCKKPHSSFVPVNQLSVEHLPTGYHNNELYDLTRALADLTVRIAIKLTSPDRPEFVPGTKDPYPCYNTRGQNSLRTGTGRVRDITKYTEGRSGYITCPCPECDNSDTPSKVWWKIDVWTARHLVFDSSEARQSSCRLWFDDDKSPVVNIYGWEVGVSDIERDMCVLYCWTHDLDVGDKLKGMLWRFVGLREIVRDKYQSRRDVDKLTIIVSHPHGCSKQVSIGHWVHRQVVEYGRTRYTYTTCTCPGSSGALVYRLGCGWSYHPHIGANSNPNSGQLNYSGVYAD